MRRSWSWFTLAVLAVGVSLWALAGSLESGSGAQPEAEAALQAVELRVNLSERRLHVVEGGRVTKSYPIAIGRAGHRTPTGTFRINRIIWNPSWVPPDRAWARGLRARGPGDPRNPMGRIKIFFREPTYFIHGTPDDASVGRAVSHGCIRMHNQDAMELGRLLMRRGGADRSAAWFERVRTQRSRTQEVRLARPIRMVVRS